MFKNISQISLQVKWLRTYLKISITAIISTCWAETLAMILITGGELSIRTTEWPEIEPSVKIRATAVSSE